MLWNEQGDPGPTGLRAWKPDGNGVQMGGKQAKSVTHVLACTTCSMTTVYLVSWPQTTDGPFGSGEAQYPSSFPSGAFPSPSRSHLHRSSGQYLHQYPRRYLLISACLNVACATVLIIHTRMEAECYQHHSIS